MYRIVYSQRFKSEISDIAEYLATHYSTKVAENTIESILSSISILIEFPRIGKFRAYNEMLGIEFHLLVTGRYFVYYSIYQEEIRIDGIKDTRQGLYII